MKSLNDQYKALLLELLDYGQDVNPRGLYSKELMAVKMVIDPEDNIVTVPGFETNLDYAREELQWYLSGSNRIDYSTVIKRTWEKYSDDGETVNSAYGHYLFSQDQWAWCVNKLRDDPMTRQAVININSLVHKQGSTKDFPCTLTIQALLRSDHLFWIVSMRSCDVFLGFRNDVYCFTQLQKIMAAELRCSVGDYTLFCGSMHLYEKQYDKVKALK